MHIVCLKISGFRRVRSADVALGRHAVLVGPSSGKTTTIEVLARKKDVGEAAEWIANAAGFQHVHHTF